MQGGLIDPDLAWAASAFAVERACGAAVPTPATRRRHGRYFGAEGAALRKMAVYTAVCGLGVSARRLAPRAGLCRATVSAFVIELEDRRDREPKVEALLEQLRDFALDWMARARLEAA